MTFSASLVYSMTDILHSVFPRGLDILRKKGRSFTLDLPIDSVSLSLQDLIGYFQPPGDHLEHEDKQNRLRALKNRQNLFQEEVGCTWTYVCLQTNYRSFLTVFASNFKDLV